MIKKYNQYLKEGVLQSLKGPSELKALKTNPTSVLEQSFFSNDIEMFRKALEYGADTEKTYNGNKFKDKTLVCFAIRNKCFEYVKLLVDFGANIKNETFLQLLGEYGDLDTIKHILDKVILTYEQYSLIIRFTMLRSENKERQRERERIVILINKYILDNVTKDVSKPWRPYKGVHGQSNKWVDKWYEENKDSLDEGLLDKMVGPTRKEIFDNFPNSIKISFIKSANTAINSNDYDIIKIFDNNGGNFIHAYSDNVNRFIRKGDYESIKILINNYKKHGVKLNNKIIYPGTIDFLRKKNREDIIKLIKNEVNEGLLDKMKGPSIEDIYKDKGLNGLTPKNLFLHSLSMGFGYGMIDAIEKGFDINSDEGLLFRVISNNKVNDSDKYDIVSHFDLNKFKQWDINNVAKTCATHNYPKTLELLLKNGAEVNEIRNTHGANAWIDENPSVMKLLKYYTEHPIKKEKQGFVSKFKNFFTNINI